MKYRAKTEDWPVKVNGVMYTWTWNHEYDIEARTGTIRFESDRGNMEVPYAAVKTRPFMETFGLDITKMRQRLTGEEE